MIQDKLSAIKSADLNLYDHIVKVLRQMVINNDRNGYQLFEYYSQKVKMGQDEYEFLQQYIAKAKLILEKPSTGGEEQAAESGPTGYVPNLLEESKWFEKCGVGFGEELTYTIFKSLEKLSITKQLKELKFWGKIYGTQSDYYIAESPAEPTEEQLPPDVEPKGTGINKTTFWVSNDLTAEWRELPIITPSQLVGSRRIKYCFTGNIDRQICTNPHFPGKEGHLLKCQIVRMNFSCTLVPRTMFNVNAEDKKQIDPASEQWKMPPFNFLSQTQNWVHHPQNILKNGRMTIMKPEIPEGVEVDEEKLMKELEMKDPLEDRLKPISRDGPCWAIKKYGDCSEYRAMTKNPTTTNHGFICIRSLVWKGWHTVYHNEQWINVYVGNGLKSSDGWFFPKEPEAIFNETGDHEEFNEPNFPPEKKMQEGEVVPEDQ